METFLRICKKLIPRKIFVFFQPAYHYLLARVGSLLYSFPQEKIHIVGITGTKGKSTTAELVNAILEEAGHKTALLSTIRFKIDKEEKRNMHKMTLPGRFFVHTFLKRAYKAGCDWIVLELTSEGAKQFRHKFIHLDALIFTNLSPEHIESHGSYEKYRDAKLSIGHELERSKKKHTTIIANKDDKEGDRFLNLNVDKKYPYSRTDAHALKETKNGFEWTFHNTTMTLNLPGQFNLYNALSAATFALSQNIDVKVVASALKKFTSVRGRVEYVQEGQKFNVVVDYAHTIDSLTQFYDVFEGQYNICILGNTGGGRDVWKRPGMASLAEKRCKHVILTNEDPYDEDPQKILDDMASGIKNREKLSVVLDRRSAIHKALIMAQKESDLDRNTSINVLLTGKGTDPYIMGPNSTKTPWDDASVVREELHNVLQQNI